MPPTISLPDKLRERLRRALSGELELPLLSATALEVLSACANEDCAAADLTSILEHDPALAGNVMRVVNSAASWSACCTTSGARSCSRR